VLSQAPPTYTVPALLEQPFTLPKGHYKYWARYLNAGSRLKIKIEWSSDVVVQFCLILNSIDSYLKDSESRCIVKMTSRSKIAFEYVTKHSADHFFVVESISTNDLTSPVVIEPIQSIDQSQAKSSSLPPARPVRNTKTVDSISTLEDHLTNSRSGARITLRESDGKRKSSSKDSSSSGVASTATDLVVSGTKETGEIYQRSLQAVDLLKVANEEPEFYILRANATFDMALLQYETTQADDLFVGSFSKEFEFNSAEWLVLYNPTDNHIYSVTISVARRYKELLITVFFIEFITISAIGCLCYTRYRHVPLLIDDETGLRKLIGKKRGHPRRHVGDTRSKSMEDMEGTDVKTSEKSRSFGSSVGAHMQQLRLPLSPETEARRVRKYGGPSAFQPELQLPPLSPPI
jgi:hypothetical protein